MGEGGGGSGATGERVTDVHRWLAESARWVEPLLERALPPELTGSPGLAESRAPDIGAVMRYALLGAGKRLRPSLVRLVCAELGGEERDAEAPAVAVECIHAYSLVHDDLPCMDDDDLRRGRPSCHRAFGEALAVLAGDALQTTAFEVLAQGSVQSAVAAQRVVEWTRVLAHAAGARGMVAGQVLDMTLSRDSADAVRAMHRLKTGALITAAAELGAIAAGADRAGERAAAVRFGAALGALFQAVDDILDVTGEARELGKTPGKDERADKASLVAVLGIDGALAEARDLAEQARAAGRELGFAPRALGMQLVDWFLERSR